MPDAGAKILDLLGQAPEARQFDSVGTRLAPGTKLPAPSPVFPRYVDED